jgi:hypothetical protein
MARHRVGNSYLSDEELAEHQSENWKVWIFIIAALLTGFVVANLTDGKIDLKLMRFSIITGSAILAGVIAAKLSEVIRWVVYLSIMLGIIYFVGSLIWSSL